MQGIYKITNKINNKSYIGISKNIYRRWTDHKVRSKDENNREYNKVLYQAFRKYGIENFSFEILEEENDLQKRKEKEQYYIKLYNSYNNGYNETTGGDSETAGGELHPNAKLTTDDVIKIRTCYANKERCKEVYKLFQDKIDFNGFHKVWKGETWKNVKMEVYTEENKNFHKHNTSQKGEENGRAKLNENQVKDIRKRKKQGESKKSVYKDYEHIMAMGGFNSVWYGYTWKNIVV